MTRHILLALLHIVEWWLAIGAVVGIAVSVVGFIRQPKTYAVRDCLIVLAGSIVAWPIVLGIWVTGGSVTSRPNGWSGGAR